MADTPVTPTTTPVTSAPTKPAGFTPNAPSKNWFPDAPTPVASRPVAPPSDSPRVNPDKPTPGPKDAPVVPDKGTKPVETKPDAQTGERKFKVMFNGKQIEVSENELISGWSHGRIADQKLQEAAAIKKKAEHFFKALKKNPAKVLNDPFIGGDAKKFAVEYLAQQIQDDQDPKSAQLRAAQEELEQFKREKADRDEQSRQVAEQQATQALSQQYARDIDAGFDNYPNLPKTPKAYDRVIYYLQLAGQKAAHEGRRLDTATVVPQIMPLVERDFKEMTRELYANATPEQLLEYFGEPIAKKLRQGDLQRLKNPIANTEVVRANKKTGKKEAPVKKNMTDFFNSLPKK